MQIQGIDSQWYGFPGKGPRGCWPGSQGQFSMVLTASQNTVSLLGPGGLKNTVSLLRPGGCFPAAAAPVGQASAGRKATTCRELVPLCESLLHPADHANQHTIESLSQSNPAPSCCSSHFPHPDPLCHPARQIGQQPSLPCSPNRPWLQAMHSARWPQGSSTASLGPPCTPHSCHLELLETPTGCTAPQCRGRGS